MQTATVIGLLGSSNVGTGLVTVGSYTVPASTAAVISQLIAANKTGATITVSVAATNGTNTYYIAYNAPVTAGDTLDMLNGSKLTLQAGYYLVTAGNTASSYDISMSVTQFV